MKKILLIIFFFNFNSYALSSVKENIINNLKNTNNFSFNFEQNINGTVEKGYCMIEYPNKRIKENFLQIDLKNNEYIIFPSTLKYFFTRNTSNKTNTYLTIAYNIA